MGVAVRFAIGLVSVLVLTLVGCVGPQSTLPAAPPSASPSPTTSAQPPLLTVPVVVAALDIPRGAKITGEMVTIVSYPLDQRPPHTFYSPTVLGTFAAIPIFRGQLIYEQMVVSAPSQVCKAT
jgi:Flp pilus assembly protein CpaB